MTPPPESERRTFAARLTGARPGEAGLVLLSALYFFFILSAYYVIRPIREEMAVAGGVENIPWLFTGTLTAMLLVHPIFAAVVSRWTRRRFVTLTYRFFMLNLLVYFVLLRVVTDGDASVWIGRTFFVWISVFNLFVVSVFWSFMTDIFRERQSRRLFGLIGVGGTVGGIVGSAITAFLVGFLSPATLLLFSVLLLEGAVVCLKALDSRCATRAAAVEGSGGGGEAGDVIGGTALEGIRRVLASPYLLGIGAFMLLFTIGSTFLYNIQADIVSRTFATGAERTSVFARIDLSVNILTLFTQLFLTGRILKWLGVRLALGILPVLSVLGFLALGAAPVFAVFVVFQVLRRAGNFALAVPTREVLYTVLPRRDKYKAKNFNDLFVYRAGDQIGVWSFAGLRALGMGSSALALTMVPLAGLWLLIALWLGRKQAALARRPDAAQAEVAAAG
ncbi:MAG: MFS transporter [Gemmatimonadales bacterium]|uniref:NTP/NDP exchange transporter n=1 Tax=Candidatus Palauibacter irciniicola TaxID=3056733 RepID=UPI001382050E|nr:MFS transporter [Candidatus Palauibacter irciniicola]MYC17345.1 MFS transporter [Gemmatimonadales bacterium]